ncbi:MAG TPA: translocation/assembly module TamB domain-containing protein [Bryobacteraceae bacterium]|nr:translocation/assembly module TamB domain-containing protein [Bryobacteraceae bacterium]
MRSSLKIALIAGGSVVALIFALVVAGILILRSTWFARQVRQKVVASVESSTGGRVEAPKFRFEWNHLYAEIDNFTLHGLEPAGVPPLLTARRVEIHFRLLSPFSGGINIASLVVDTPRLNVIVFPNGTTNIPHPTPSSSAAQSLRDVVDLAIGRFQVIHGFVTFADRPSAFEARGQNLVARLAYNPRHPGYTGELDISPLVFQSGSRPPVDLNLKLPIVIDRARIAVSNGRLANAQSTVAFSAEVSHLDAPTGWARVRADVALADLDRAAGLKLRIPRGAAPPRLRADINAGLGPHRLDIRAARITLGESHVDAEGTLLSSGRLTFNGQLALGQIARMLNWPARPQGTANVKGSVEFRKQGWLLNGNVTAANLTWTEGATQLRGLNLSSAVTADRQKIDLHNFSLTGAPFGPGGGFSGSAQVENLRTFQVAGNLRFISVALVSRLFLARPLAFAGLASGPVELHGDFRNSRDLTARASVAIVPGGPGIPLSGRLNLTYNGRADTVVLGPSRFQLPHTHIELAGSLNRRIDVRLVSRNLEDLRPLGPIPLELVNGVAVLSAAVTGRLSAPQIQGHAALTNFAFAGRRFSSFAGDFTASPAAVSVANASLARGPLHAEFAGTLGLRNWKPQPWEPLRLDATLRNADFADVLALVQPSISASGSLTADVHVAGTLGSPTGSAAITVANGSIEGEHFDTLTARAAMTPQSIEIPMFSLAAGASRIAGAVDYRHPVNQLDQGTLHAQIAANQVQLANFRPLTSASPGLAGLVNLNADFTAGLGPTPSGVRLQIAALNGSFSGRHLQMDGRSLGDFTANVNTASGAIHYSASSNFGGSTIHVTGQSLVAGDHATTASLQISNLPIEPALELAREDLPLRGLLSASARVSGTLADPNIAGTVTVAKGSAWQQPFDRLESTFDYSNTLIDLTSLRVTAGPADLTASGSFSHPAGNYRQGQVRFKVDTNPIQLAQIRPLENAEPGLAGTVQLTAQGAAALRSGAAPLFSTLEADLAARGVSISGQPLGELTASAHTRGQETVFSLTSNFAHADIHGSGRLQLTGDYPLSAQLGFTGLTYAALRPLFGGPSEPFSAVADGSASIGGSLVRPSDLRGFIQISRFELHSAPPSAGRETRVRLDLRNSGPMVASLDRGLLTIQNAHLSGPFTQLTFSGAIPLTGATGFNIRADGNLNLTLLEAFNPDLYSSGSVTLAAVVTGSLRHPAVNGRLGLTNVSLSIASFPNGISRASGTIVFNGNDAIIQNFTGQSGGGKVTVAGIISYGGPQSQIRLTLTADHVWVEYPQTVTTEANARLALAGTVARSLLSGDVTILNVALHPQTDIGSLLTQAASRPAVMPSSSEFLTGMDFDVRIRTAPDVQFRTSLVQNLQAEANLTLRGSPLYPGMLGRIVITQGQVLFFGAKYSLDQGTISFFDPNRINPNLNIELETMVQGIEVTISVTGPMDRLNLSYRSDPPMQFSDLVALLTSGRTPVSDPVLAAHTPPMAEQSFQQAGASALFGAAVAQPVTGRLQRLFGVTTLQVNPLIIGPTTNTTQASITLQQQIAPNITLTYVQDVVQNNPLAVQVQWDINPNWSIVAQRDIYGFFDLDVYWKRRFH